MKPQKPSQRTANSDEPPPVDQNVPLRKLLQPLKEPLAESWRLVVASIVAGWGKFILPMAVPMLTGHLIDNVLPNEVGPGTRQEFITLGVLAMVILVLIAAATYYRQTLAQKLASQLQHKLRKKLFHHIQRLSMAFFARHHAGSLGSRVSSDITHAGIVVDKGIIQLSMDGVSLLTLGIIMWNMNPILTVVSMGVLGVNSLIILAYVPRIRRGRKDIQEHQSSVTGRAAEYFSGITVVKAYAGEGESGRAFAQSSREVQDLQVANSKLMGSYQGISHALVVFCQLFVALLGGWMIIYHPGALTVGNLVSFLMYVGLINGSVQRLSDSMVQIQDGFAALERIHDILAVAPNPADAPDAVTPALTGRLRFENVGFGYTPDKPVIHNFTFQFDAGKSYALVGASGRGKSTLTQMMLRFYDPSSGHIFLDETPMRKVQQSHFRRHVAAVLQDPIIFSTSVKENIGFAAGHPSLEEIKKAAVAAQAHDFIVDKPDGYNARLGERGVSLSGGQRQRIAIARALMRDPRILILDEATSALDTVTERSIQGVIDGLQGSRTVVIIAHRLSTIRNVDEILVMDRGRLVEHGTYNQLLAAGGVFAKLAEQQASDAA